MKFYHTPSLTIKKYDCSDIITASVMDDSEEFNMGWIVN